METLVALWTDKEIQQKFESMVHNGKIWDNLSDKFKELTQVERSGKQLKQKIKKLRKWYREYKKGHGKSGASGEKDNLKFEWKIATATRVLGSMVVKLILYYCSVSFLLRREKYE